VKSAALSKYAIPISLLSQIRGETTMGWTGWVFRMKDGQLFSYGTSFLMEFFHLPDGYSFSEVEEVINHSFADSHGNVISLKRGALLQQGYRPDSVLREPVFFTCALEGM
jgi:hypothetical protein